MGRELWSTDGTVAKTKMVMDLYTGASSSNPTELTIFNNYLYFIGYNGVNTGTSTSLSGGELFRCDGTIIQLVKDINPSSTTGSYVKNLIVFQNKLFFAADDGVSGTELYSSDGELNGQTSLVKDINDLNSDNSNPLYLTVYNDKLIFQATNGASRNGLELWISTGSAESTYMLKDLVVGSTGSNPQIFTLYNNYLFFIAFDANTVENLWRTDGTTDGTVWIYPINTPFLPNPIAVYNGAMFLPINDGTRGNELFRSEGTTETTSILRDIVVGSGSGIPLSTTSQFTFVEFRGLLYFRATDSTSGTEICK